MKAGGWSLPCDPLQVRVLTVTVGHGHAGSLDELLARVAPCSTRRVTVMNLNRILR